MNGIRYSCLSHTSFAIIGILLKSLASRPYMVESPVLSVHWCQEFFLYSLTRQNDDFWWFWEVHPSSLTESHVRVVSSDTQFKLFMFPFQYAPTSSRDRKWSLAVGKANAWMPRFPSLLDILDSYILSGLMLVFWLQCVWSLSKCPSHPQRVTACFKKHLCFSWPHCPSPTPLRSLRRHIYFFLTRKMIFSFKPLCHVGLSNTSKIIWLGNV